MPTLQETITLPGGVDPSQVRTTLQLWAVGEGTHGFESGVSIGGPRVVTGNPWSIAGVVGNDDIIPAGTVYRVTRKWPGLDDPLVDFVEMPTAGGPYRVDEILADEPATVESSALTLHKRHLHLEHVTVPAAWGQNRWNTARNDADTRQVKVHLWGDSIFQGSGASNERTLGCAQLIADELHERYGDGGTGWLPAGLATSSTGTWTSGMGMGGCQRRATAAASLQFTALLGSSIRIFHRNANITGSFRWRVNGGGWNTVTPPVLFGQDPAEATVSPGGNGPHTLDIEWVSGTVDIFGVEATYPTGVVTYRFAQSGRAASDFTPGLERKITRVSASGAVTTLTCAAPGSFTDDLVGKFVHGPAQIAPGTNGGGVTVASVASATSLTLSTATTGSFSGQTVTFSTNGTIGVLGANMAADPFLAAAVGRPDLVIIQLGANDPAGVNNSADTFRAGISKLMRLYSTGDSIDYTPDFALVLEHIGNWFDVESEYSAMAAVVADLAGGNGAALVDIWGIGHRSHDYWDDLGYFADTIHPSTTGHVQYAAPVIALLTEH